MSRKIHIVITRHYINEDDYYKTADVFWNEDGKRKCREMRFGDETDDEIEHIVEQEIRYGEA